MDYFLLVKGQKRDELIFDINQVGSTNDFKKFYPEKGFELINKLIDLNEQKVLNKISIVSSNDKEKYTIEEFIDFLVKNKFKVMKRYD